MTESRFPVHCPIEVRFRDCDMMGHVNNAVYLTYLEVARFAYWRAAGLDRVADEVSYILARVEIDYRAQAEVGEVLDVAAGVTGIGRSSFSMAFEIRNPAGRLVAAAKSVQVAYDYGARAPVPVPDAVRARIAEFEGKQYSSSV
ncbi:MAG TPA: thioesterase family protein [Vicinamibacterales bacterium]|nr:thioesterase family protein [Vicinamibacterales bacterium]HOQ59709.1 thioesterase family protein [Vicinamibacterales bacterium]HPK70734.1 thioesterase family protein [Vicinamibacterales bacterium]